MNPPAFRFATDGGIGTLVLDNPEKRNALDPSLLRRLNTILDEVESDLSVRVLVLSGAGDKAFCSGYDVSQLSSAEGEYDPTLFDRTMKRLGEFPRPLIGRINGHAFGGGAELMLCTDLRIARRGIRIGMPPARLGIVYSEEGLQKFINAIGLARTRRLFFTGEPIDDPTALAWGMLDEVTDSGSLEGEVDRLAKTLAANAPLSLAGMKRITARLTRAPLSDADRGDILRWRMEAFLSEDFREGQAAFLEKRTPRFTGK